jgi:ketosteroid isomerase-like protein
MTDPAEVVGAFNQAINDRDLAALAALMTDTHRFVDATGSTVEGKAACVEAWRGFFDSFPDYRNVFDHVVAEGEGVVEVNGHSVCSVAELDGPARWRAVVRDGRVDLWQVFEPD